MQDPTLCVLGILRVLIARDNRLFIVQQHICLAAHRMMNVLWVVVVRALFISLFQYWLQWNTTHTHAHAHTHTHARAHSLCPGLK